MKKIISPKNKKERIEHRLSGKFLNPKPTCVSKFSKPTIGLKTNTCNIIFSKRPTSVRKLKTWHKNILRGQAEQHDK